MRIAGRQFQGFKRTPDAVSLSSWQGPSSYGRENPQVWAALQKLPIVYSCVKAIIDPLAGYPRRVLNSAGIPVDAPMWVDDPNPLMSGGDFVSAVGLSLILDSNAYIYPTYNSSGQVIMLGVANPRTVSHYVSGGKVEWWVNGQRTNMEFIHLRALTSPGSIEGVSKLGPLKLTTEISVESLRYIRQFLLRGVALQMLFKGNSRHLDSPVGRQNIDQILTDFHRGFRNAFNALKLPPGIDVEFIDSKLLNDMSGWTNLRAVTDAEIAASFGLDPEEVNVRLEESSRTYTNEPSRRARKYENAVKPVAKIIEAGLSTLLPPGYSFDLDQHESLYGGPHDRANLVEKISVAEKHTGTPLLSVEEKRMLLGFTGPVPAGTEIDTGGNNDV